MSKNKFQLDYSRNKDDFFIESRKIVGLKPVTKANIDYFISEEVSREQAEVLAAEEYLTHFLQLDREEISKLNIFMVTIQSSSSLPSLKEEIPVCQRQVPLCLGQVPL